MAHDQPRCRRCSSLARQLRLHFARPLQELARPDLPALRPVLRANRPARAHRIGLRRVPVRHSAQRELRLASGRLPLEAARMARSWSCS